MGHALAARYVPEKKERATDCGSCTWWLRYQPVIAAKAGIHFDFLRRAIVVDEGQDGSRLSPG
jgi:hypothetical protein